MKLAAALLAGGVLFFTTGGATAATDYWFEPPAELLAEERAGELIPEETEILDTYLSPEGIKFQLVTYRTTKWRCFDVTVETDKPLGSGGGCGGIEEQAAGLKGSELKITGNGSTSGDAESYSHFIGIAGPDVRAVRISFSDGTSRLATVSTEARVWFGASTPPRSVVNWEPVTSE